MADASQNMEFDPNEIELTPEDLARERIDDKLTPGWYQFTVSKAKVKLDKNGLYVVQLTCAPLDPDDGETKRQPVVWHRITVPVKRGDAIPPPWAKRMATEYLQSTRGEDFGDAEPPRSDVEEFQAYRDKVLETFVGMAKAAQQFERDTFFAEITHSGDFQNIRTLKSSLPGNKELVPLAQFRFIPAIAADDAEETEEAEAAPTPTKKTNGKAVPSKVAPKAIVKGKKK